MTFVRRQVWSDFSKTVRRAACPEAPYSCIAVFSSSCHTHGTWYTGVILRKSLAVWEITCILFKQAWSNPTRPNYKKIAPVFQTVWQKKMFILKKWCINCNSIDFKAILTVIHVKLSYFKNSMNFPSYTQSMNNWQMMEKIRWYYYIYHFKLIRDNWLKKKHCFYV